MSFTTNRFVSLIASCCLVASLLGCSGADSPLSTGSTAVSPTNVDDAGGESDVDSNDLTWDPDGRQDFIAVEPGEEGDDSATEFNVLTDTELLDDDSPNGGFDILRGTDDQDAVKDSTQLDDNGFDILRDADDLSAGEAKEPILE